MHRELIANIVFGLAAQFAVAGPVLGADTPVAEDRRAVLESLLRDEFVKALVPPFKLDGSETKEIRIKNDFPPIDTKIGDYGVAACAAFPDARKELKLKVESLAVRDEKTLVGRVSVSCPAKGSLDATAGPIKAHTDFDAVASIQKLDVEVTWAVDDGGDLIYHARVIGLKTEVKDVRFRGDLAKTFGEINDLARNAANSWLAMNESRFADQMNKALDEAFRDGRLKVSPKDLTK